MSKSTISTFQLFEMFPDAESARKHIEAQRWPNGAICPACGLGDRVTARKNGFYRCNQCREDFTVRTGTVFERSHIPLHKWLYAVYLLVTARKGISSLQLSKEIGVTQKSAWFMLQRLREACGSDDGRGKLQGMNGLFFRADSVNHSAGEYTKGTCHTNSIESVWAVLKRGIYGVYHQVSAKHLARYVDEFAFRLNQGNVGRHSLERLDSFV